MNREEIETIRKTVFEKLNAADQYRAAKTGRSFRADPSQPLARYFDHTLLKPEARDADFVKLCTEARRTCCYSVCVPPRFVSLCRSELSGSPVAVCTVIGFPLGYSETRIKAKETGAALAAGGSEFDMVLPIGVLKHGDLPAVYRDIQAVVEAAGGNPVKVILETCLLSDEEKVVASSVATAAGAAFLKTSTGFSSAGATLDDVRLMRILAGEKIGVKAAGGIRDRRAALEFIQAGADRLGSSSTVKILEEK